MGRAKSVLRNTLALWMPDFLNPLLSFVLIMAISRYMGVDGLGKYSLVLAYAGIFTTMGALGLVSLIVREAAKRPEEVHVFMFNAGVFGAVASVVSLMAMVLVVALLGYDRDVFRSCVIMALTLPVSTLVRYMDGVFRSFEKSQYVALTYVAENVLRVALCLFAVLYGYGIVMVFVATLAARIFAFVVLGYFYITVLGLPVAEFRSETWRMLAKQSPVFLSIAIASTIHLNIDQIMLSKLQGVESVGLYSAASRLLGMCTALPLAFSCALLPFFTREFGAGVESLARFVAATTRYAFLGGFPVVVGTLILADEITVLIYGTKFVESIPILRVLIVSLIPVSLLHLLAQVLIATDNQKVDLTINIVCAGLNVALNFLLIPVFAEMGAALAAVGTMVVFNQLQYHYIKKHLFSLPFFQLMSRAALASAGMGVVTIAGRDLNLFANIAMSAAAYFILVYVLRGLTPEEMASLKGWSKRALHR